jgi:glycosyltransferase involved in cell wall biosynthesis
MAMKVLHLATQDKGGGGGGFEASYRLHCHMKAAGVDSVMAVLRKCSSDPSVIDVSAYLTTTDRLRWLLASLLARAARYRRRSARYFVIEKGEWFPLQRLTRILPFKPDAIVAHWVSHFLSARMMQQLSSAMNAPLYWYMMDMAPLTGGCHYAFECQGYTQRCGQCPQLKYGREPLDLSHRQLQKKQSDLLAADITAVVPTSWLKRQAMASTLFSTRSIKQVMLGIDVNMFKPIAQGEARSVLGLPADRKIIFFGAHHIHDERKGFRYLREALGRLHGMLERNLQLRRSILVVTAGSQEGDTELEMSFEHRHLGFLKGDVRLAAAYQAADVFVNASTEDSGPMMINESILCGTPVVSFDMGVAPDLVHTGRTGYRARLRDAGDMATGLLRVLEMDGDGAQVMRAACRTLGMELCHPDVQVRSFLELFAAHTPVNLPGPERCR